MPSDVAVVLQHGSDSLVGADKRRQRRSLESPLASAPVEAGFSFVRKGYDPLEVDKRIDELATRLAASEQRAAHLARELEGTAHQAAELMLRFDTERDRAIALEHQLNDSRQQEEAARLILHEASKTRDTMLSEAEATLEDARAGASREAGQITEQAMGEASNMIAKAKRESATILEAGREKLTTLEHDAAQRISDLDGQHRELTLRLRALDTVYTELRATLKFIAETAIDELLTAQSSPELLGLSDSTELLGLSDMQKAPAVRDREQQ